MPKDSYSLEAVATHYFDKLKFSAGKLIKLLARQTDTELSRIRARLDLLEQYQK